MPRGQNGGGRRKWQSSKILQAAMDVMTIHADFKRKARTWYKFSRLSDDLIEIAAKVQLEREQLTQLRKEKKQWEDKQVKKGKTQSVSDSRETQGKKSKSLKK